MSIRHASLLAEAAGVVETATPPAQRPSKLAAELRQARDEIMRDNSPTGGGAQPPPSNDPARLTVWDRYAIAALTGYLAANPECKVGANNASHEAAIYADAMMSERGKRGIGL